MSSVNLCRGLRNKNPFNIEKSSNQWLGKVALYLNTDKRFEQFYDLKYGLRAGIILLRNYIRVYKLDDVESIISRFAPDKENDTKAYVSFVSEYLSDHGCSSYGIEYGSESFYCLCAAMVKYESKMDLSKEYFESVKKYFAL